VANGSVMLAGTRVTLIDQGSAETRKSP
jgi:hypothetical protein